MTAITDSPQPRSPEWHKLRHGSFNASSASVLFDRHPFQTPGDLAVSKLADEPIVEDDNPAMRRGRHMEAAIADWYSEEYGVKVYEASMHRKGVMMFSPDRWIPASERYLEIKTTSQYVDEPLVYWVDQCQAGMHCTDTETMVLAWVDATMQMQVAEIDRDDEFIADMVGRAERFMAAIEMGMVPDWIQPELTAANVTALHPAPVGEKELSEADVALLAHYGHLKEYAKALDAEMADVKDALARVLADAEAGVFNGETLVTFKAPKREPVFDRAAFHADHPGLYAEYLRAAAPSRTFLPKYHKIPNTPTEEIGF
jgi:predicted phage-related endonuclease